MGLSFRFGISSALQCVHDSSSTIFQYIHNLFLEARYPTGPVLLLLIMWMSRPSRFVISIRCRYSPSIQSKLSQSLRSNFWVIICFAGKSILPTNPMLSVGGFSDDPVKIPAPEPKVRTPRITTNHQCKADKRRARMDAVNGP